jgi:hypothetical protein
VAGWLSASKHIGREAYKHKESERDEEEILVLSANCWLQAVSKQAHSASLLPRDIQDKEREATTLFCLTKSRAWKGLEAISIHIGKQRETETDKRDWLRALKRSFFP